MEQVTDDYVESTAFRRWGLQPTKTGKEWHSACPICREGRDRFIIFGNGATYCRVCGVNGWLNDDRRDWKRDDLKIQHEQERTEQLEHERQETLATWQRAYRDGYVQGWHDAMQEQHRAYWRGEGIPDWAIDGYRLGFCSGKRITVEHAEVVLPTYTIPIYHPTTHAIVNIQYRLVDPPSGVGKYRQEYGIPAASFYAADKVDGEAIVVEGAKKAIVLFHALDRTMQVVGLPSNCPSEALLDELRSFSCLYLILDPNSHKQVERIVRLLHPRIRIVTMPCKPDDAIVKYGLAASGLRSYLDMARST